MSKEGETITTDEAKRIIQNIKEMYPDAELNQTESFNIACDTYCIDGINVNFHYIGNGEVYYNVVEAN